ncbi:MAG TPA: lysylphosphatidylglycerol synthase transmembrane domain-containing protein [Bacteroidales bacterium]|nr:lysylphosphatidylglycerol synthase transmembrane domain-containing protein [Bacteroidales bacterium]HPT08781.1 lysylphosphatidylglycerol synthase transmembrane domain-containing protein [Bacteroidales bacterium]
MNNQSKIRKIANLVIRLLILVVTLGFIYKQVFYKNDIPALLENFSAEIAEPGFTRGMVIVLLLMILNWSIETWKWRYLISKIERISFFKALQAVLVGTSISSFTPNRIGEFFGRVFILRKSSHIEGILITVLGSMSQLLITLLTGSAALLLLLPRYFSETPFGHGYLYYSLTGIVIGLDLLLVGIFFNLSFISTLKEKIFRNKLKRFRKFFRVFGFYHPGEIGAVILLSFSRYLVFSFQFYLLLRLFGVIIPLPVCLGLIALIYFIMAVVPTITLAEIGIRGSVALYVFDLYFASSGGTAPSLQLSIFAASTLLWIINVGFPALTGTLFLYRLQFFRDNRARS